MQGLYAAGECSCISIHGANRLGCNSLVDLVVFGRRAGKLIDRDLQKMDWQELPDNPSERAEQKLEKLKQKSKGEKTGDIRASLQKLMSEQCSVFRDETGLRDALSELHSLKRSYEDVAIDDRGALFNTDLMDACEWNRCWAWQKRFYCQP